MPSAATLLAVVAAASAPYRVAFDGHHSDKAATLVRTAFSDAEARWKTYSGLPLQLRKTVTVHVVTERSRVPGAKGGAVKPACANVPHLFVFTDDRGVPGSDTPPQGPGSTESLKREVIRRALESTRKGAIPAWLEASAVLASAENPQLTFLDGPAFRQLYAEGHVGRGASLPRGPARLENCIAWTGPNPWTVLMLRYVREAKGPEAIARILQKASGPEDVAALAENIPVGSTTATPDRFDADFDPWVRKKYEIIAAADGGVVKR